MIEEGGRCCLVTDLTTRGGEPRPSSGFEESQGTDHVGLGESKGIFNAPIDVALRGKMDHAVDRVIAEQFYQHFGVADVAPREGVIGFILDVGQVLQVARVGEFIKVNDPVLGVVVNEQSHHVRANESCATCYQYISLKCSLTHIVAYLLFCLFFSWF